MNKIKKILLATIGGVEAVFNMALPILVAFLWIKSVNWQGWSAIALLVVGFIASIFRAIKIGWMK